MSSLAPAPASDDLDDEQRGRLLLANIARAIDALPTTESYALLDQKLPAVVELRRLIGLIPLSDLETTDKDQLISQVLEYCADARKFAGCGLILLLFSEDEDEAITDEQRAYLNLFVHLCSSPPTPRIALIGAAIGLSIVFEETMIHVAEGSDSINILLVC